MSISSWIDQGRQHIGAARFAQAASCFEKALLVVPDSAEALAPLGHCYNRLGRTREAAACLAHAARVLAPLVRKSGKAAPLLDVAYELQLAQAPAESVQWIDKALKAEPASARAHHLKALALSRLNDVKGARQSAARALNLAPNESNAIILLATLEAQDGALAAARARLEPVAANVADVNRARALFELGRVLDGLGECEQAFEHVVQAGQLTLARTLASPGMQGYDPQSLYRELEQERTHCTPDWYQDWGQHGEVGRQAAPVFMIGFYRSGTTLLEQVLAAHPAVQCTDEADLIPHVLRELARLVPQPGLHWTQRWAALGPGAAAQMREVYWQRAESSMGPGVRERLLLDKTALNTINIGVIHALFPEARIIFALRDPRDVLLSCFMQAFAPNSLTAHLLDWQEAARFYAAVMTHWRFMHEHLPLRATTIRYEDLVADTEGALTPLLGELGLQWQAGMGRHHEQTRRKVISTPSFADVAKPVYTTARGRWLRYAGRFDSVLPELQPWLEYFGYAQ